MCAAILAKAASWLRRNLEPKRRQYLNLGQLVFGGWPAYGGGSAAYGEEAISVGEKQANESRRNPFWLAWLSFFSSVSAKSLPAVAA